MKRASLAIALLLPALAACQDNSPQSTFFGEAAVNRSVEPPPVMAQMAATYNSNNHTEGQVAPKTQADSLTESRHVKREHSLTLKLPADAVLSTARRRADSCVLPACLIETASIQPAQAAEVSMRVLPDRVGNFLDLVRQEGEVVAEQTSSLDMTGAWLDADRRLAAKKSLRERLTGMLANHQTSQLGDLVQLEREIAQVQGEIETGEARLRAMALQTDRELVRLSYSAKYEPVSHSTFEPLRRSLDRWLSEAIDALADVVSFSAVALPWIAFSLLVLGAWRLVGRLPKKYAENSIGTALAAGDNSRRGWRSGWR